MANVPTLLTEAVQAAQRNGAVSPTVAPVSAASPTVSSTATNAVQTAQGNGGITSAQPAATILGANTTPTASVGAALPATPAPAATVSTPAATPPAGGDLDWRAIWTSIMGATHPAVNAAVALGAF